MGWYLSKVGTDYTFQDILGEIAKKIEVEDEKCADKEPLKIEVTIRSKSSVETIDIPIHSVKEIVEMLKLNTK